MEPPRCPSPPPEPQTRRNWPQKFPPRGRTQVRNRRYGALRRLIREGDYFSEERMRRRAPALFHHYIGRFRPPRAPQNPPKIPQTNPKIPQSHPRMSQSHQNQPQTAPNGPKMAPNGPKMAPNGPRAAPALRELLLTALQEAEAEDEDEDEEEEEEDEDDEDEDEEQPPDEAEQELLRLEFTSRMHQRFLEGLDGDFDYSQVDGDSELDTLDLLSQDLEDRYFDEEEPGPAPPLS